MKFLVIYNDEGSRVASFPVNHITYEVIDGVLRVESYNTLFTYKLDRYDYAIENSQRVRKARALA